MTVRGNHFAVAALFADQFKRPVGYHLVNVNVIRRSCPSLKYIEIELIGPWET